MLGLPQKNIIFRSFHFKPLYNLCWIDVSLVDRVPVSFLVHCKLAVNLLIGKALNSLQALHLLAEMIRLVNCKQQASL